MMNEIDQFENNTEGRFQTQISVLTVFFLLSCIADVFYVHFGKFELQNNDLLCYNKGTIIVANEEGSVALLIYTLVAYSYTVVMLFVFYHLPKKSGLVLDVITGD